MKVERRVRVRGRRPSALRLIMSRPARGRVTFTITAGERSSAAMKKGSKLTQCLRFRGKKFNVHWTVGKTSL